MLYCFLLFSGTRPVRVPQIMCARPAVLQIPSKSSVPSRLPLYKIDPLLTHSESTLLQVLILLHFNSLIINTYKKPGEGVPPPSPKVLQLVTRYSRSMRPRHTRHAALATHHSSLATIPFRITSFADPHVLTPIESHSYKKQGRGCPAPRNTAPKVHESPIASHGISPCYTPARLRKRISQFLARTSRRQPIS